MSDRQRAADLTLAPVGPIVRVDAGPDPTPPQPHGCSWGWGSHSCDLPCHAGGNHQCLDDGDVCGEVDPDGRDGSGFRWTLYGGLGDETHPSWRLTDQPCPRCGSALLVSVDGAARCCPASVCGCSRGACGWYERSDAWPVT